MNDSECGGVICDESVGLLMTYRCNLNCSYCYIHTKKNKDMTLEMAKSILEPFLLKHAGLLNIAFMGGETLMAMDVIRPLVEWVVAGTWNRPYRFFGSTNGTLLTEDMRQWLKKISHVFTLGLSYDGLPETQAGNRGSRDIDIDFFIKTWPEQPVQMTINSDSVYKMAEGVIYLLEKGAHVHPNVAYEKNEWSDYSVSEYARQLDELISYYQEHPDRPLISQFVHDLNEYASCIEHHQAQTHICGAGYGFQVFDTDGCSYPCHILSPLVLEGDKLQKVKDGLIADKENGLELDCKDCPYVSSCPTCIACNFLYRNGLGNRDKTHCDIMKLEVKAFIKKEVHRLSEKEQLTSDDAHEIDSIRKLYDYQKTIK